MPSLKEEAADESVLGKAGTSRSFRTLLQSSKADFLTAYLTRKPHLTGLAGFDLELSDAEEEAPAVSRSAAAAAGPPRRRVRLEPLRWQDALRGSRWTTTGRRPSQVHGAGAAQRRGARQRRAPPSSGSERRRGARSARHQRRLSSIP